MAAPAVDFRPNVDDDGFTDNGGFMIDDREAMPDDGRRYELIGGAIVVTPSPGIDRRADQGALRPRRACLSADAAPAAQRRRRSAN